MIPSRRVERDTSRPTVVWCSVEGPFFLISSFPVAKNVAARLGDTQRECSIGRRPFFLFFLGTDAQDAVRRVPSGSPKKTVVRARCDRMHHRARSDSPNSFQSAQFALQSVGVVPMESDPPLASLASG